MRAFGRFLNKYGSRMRNPNIFGIRDSLMDQARAKGGLGKLSLRHGIRSSAYIGAGIAATGYAGYKMTNFREGLVKGMYPGSVMPMEAGRFGIRTNNTPAGIGGVRFNFRRK